MSKPRFIDCGSSGDTGAFWTGILSDKERAALRRDIDARDNKVRRKVIAGNVGTFSFVYCNY